MDETRQNGTGETRGRLFEKPGELEKDLSLAADLACLNLGDEERRVFAESVARMLEFFATMDDFPAADIRRDRDRSPGNRLRPDCGPSLGGPDLVDLAPKREGRFVSLPNIL